MKNKNIKNSNGIAICDSIIMSVKKKRPNFRNVEAVLIAVCGFVSAIMTFFSMFSFSYSRPAVIFAAILFSAVYITLSLIGRKGMWIAAASAFAALFISYRYIEKLALGFKFIYNRIYSASYHTDISYYKFLKPEIEKSAATAFFILVIWAIALIIYTFTIYRPNTIPPLIVTFPLIEVGLYNGMKVSIFWGMLLVAYWLALFAMTAIDIGEYSGGNGGFVRRENLFFPKRQMRLKVTEKCGVIVIAEVLVITAVTVGTMKLFNYKRSDDINRKRIEVRDAVNSFTIDDIAGSVSNITSAFGFTFRLDTHKLGNVDRLRYKNTTDLIVTLDRKYSGAIYLKEYTGSVYSADKWTSLPDSVYDTPLFDDFKDFSIYPQDFPHTFDSIISPGTDDYTIWIDSKLRSNRSFAPYGTDSLGILEYNFDKEVTSKKGSKDEFSYKFSPYTPDKILPSLFGSSRNVYFLHRISDPDWRDTITALCTDEGLLSESGEYFYIDSSLSADTEIMYSAPEKLLTQLLEQEYADFVYDNYLQLPDTAEITEIRDAFSDILGNTSAQTERLPVNVEIQKLDALREKITTMAEYSLDPGRTPSNRDFVNYFLLENHKGYCTHYASAGVVLARMAGIPARYATGYVLVGDDFSDDNRNPSGSYTINVKDNRSHAWVEVYLNGYGWVPYEFTAGYSQQSIDTTPTTSALTTSTTTETTSAPENETTTDTSGTKKPQRTTTKATTATTTAATVTTAVKHGIGSGGSFRLNIPPAVKYTLYTLLLIAAFISALLLRRILILYFRRKRMREGDSTGRMRYIYGFAEKLLGIIGIERGGESQMDFAEKVDKALGGKLFPAGSFTACTDAALRAAFSENIPDKSEADKYMKFAESFAKKLYSESKPLRRFWLKFINVIQ